MSVELRPLGVTCNLGCSYCYQRPQRDVGAPAARYDLAAMKAALAEEGAPFTLFGGEPLLIPLADLEELWRFGFERFGRNAIQTNGILIEDAHVALFARYAVDVGISVDGPGELNDARWRGTLAATRAATARTARAIERLCAAGRPPGLIVTLHRGNAGPARLPALIAWLRELDALGVTRARLHVLEVDAPAVQAHLALAPADNARVLRALAELELDLPRLRFDVFGEQEALLLGRDHQASCVWRGCDPSTTAAVRGVEGDGARTSCGRVNKDGIDFVKAERPGYERYLALYRTPQAHGGCAGCRFFVACKGQCPGTAIDGDWRNRTEHCETWKALFEWVEARLIARGHEPLSRRADLPALEADLLAAWERGDNPSLEALLARRRPAAPP